MAYVPVVFVVLFLFPPSVVGEITLAVSFVWLVPFLLPPSVVVELTITVLFIWFVLFGTTWGVGGVVGEIISSGTLGVLGWGGFTIYVSFFLV